MCHTRHKGSCLSWPASLHQVQSLYCSCVSCHVGWTDREQIRSRINNNDRRTFRPQRPLLTVYRTKETAVCDMLYDKHWSMVSCNHCYWFCYISAHDQFARYWQSSNEPLQHHLVMCWCMDCVWACGVGCHLPASSSTLCTVQRGYTYVLRIGLIHALCNLLASVSDDSPQLNVCSLPCI